MELLAWPSLTTPEEVRVRAFLRGVVFCELTVPVRQTAVRLRREKRLKLPDAIVYATALEHRTKLWTNDGRLHAIGEVVCRSVTLQTADTL